MGCGSSAQGGDKMTTDEKVDQVDQYLDPEEEELPQEAQHAIVRSRKPAVAQLRADLAAHKDVVSILRVAAIKATYPQDWIDQGGGNVFLQGSGAERLITASPVSVHITDMSMQRVDMAEGDIPYYYIFSATARVKVPGIGHEVTFPVQAARGADKFFSRLAESQRTVPNPTLVSRSALTALVRRALTEANGLRGLRREQLADVMGEGFAARITSAERQIAKDNASRAGAETEDERKQWSGAHRRCAKELERITPNRDLWPYLLQAVGYNPDHPEWKPKSSISVLTEKAAGYHATRLARIPAMAEDEATVWAQIRGICEVLRIPEPKGIPQ